MEPEPSSGGPKDAFALLMSAGRLQQNGRRQQQQQQRKRSASGASPPQQQKRQRQQDSDPSLPTQQSPQVASQDSLSPASAAAEQAGGSQGQLDSPGAGATPAAASSKQAAVAAFKRAFSAGLCKQPAAQRFDFLLVYDLEATCNKARTLHPVEIMELSCVCVHTATASIRASYQSFVKPTEHPQLDPFAVQLCGIQQHQVDGAPLLAEVLQHHHQWLQQQGVLDQGVSSVPVTWTEWDLKVALCTECGWRRIQRPDYLCRWVDLKKYFKARYKKGGNLKACVQAAGLTWEGRAHSGIDDATNTAKLAIHLMRQGVRFEVTQVSENPPRVQQPQQHLPSSSQQPGSQGMSSSGAAAAAAAGGGGGAAAAAAGSRGGVQAGTAAEPPAGSPEAGGAGSQADRVGQGQGTASRDWSSLAQRAAQKGASGVCDASGKWLGRCFCGAKAKSRVTKRPGPNHGRQFWSCGRWTITAQQTSSCDFFMWAD